MKLNVDQKRVSEIVSSKPFPDESNREGIEQMLLHAFDFAVESGLLSLDDTEVEMGGKRVLKNE